MGAKRKVDAKLYAKVKKELKTPDDDKYVMAKFNLGQTSVRAIRNSKTYNQFVIKTSGKKKPAKKKKPMIEKRNFKVNPKAKGKMPKKPTFWEKSPQEQAQSAWIWFVSLALLGMLLVVFLVVKWILSWFGI